MSPYSHSAQQSSFSLLARAFAFRAGARFTGLLDPAFFQSLADKHHVPFGQGPDDTFNPEVTLWAWLRNYPKTRVDHHESGQVGDVFGVFG